MSEHTDAAITLGPSDELTGLKKAIREVIAVLRRVEERRAHGEDADVDVHKSLERWGHLAPEE